MAPAGMLFVLHPPHRSSEKIRNQKTRRAELSHRAPTSCNNAKANQWIGMADPGQWNPFDYQALHPIPCNTINGDVNGDVVSE